MLRKELEQFKSFAEENRLLKTLTEEQITDLSSKIIVRKFPKGTIIVRENAYKENGFYLIGAGWVKIASYSNEGTEQILNVLTRHDFFGEMSLLEDKPTSAAVVAKTSCTVYALPKAVFFHVLTAYPECAIELLRLLSARIRSANRLVANFAFMNASSKLKMYFLDLAHRRGTPNEKGQMIISNVPTQLEIGTAIGHRRETIAREMKKMSDSKIISYSRKEVVIYDIQTLQV